jgi:hypothetical protein
MGLKASTFTKGNSAFVKSDDVKDGPQKFTIEGIEAAETPDKKPALQLVFVGGKKLTLNKTNARVCAGSFGDDCDTWLGKKVLVTYDPTVMFSGKMVGGMKVFPVTAKPAAAVEAPATREPGDEDDSLA